jgi:hypothetical protein
MAAFLERRAQHLRIAVDVGGHGSRRAKCRTLGSVTGHLGCACKTEGPIPNAGALFSRRPPDEFARFVKKGERRGRGDLRVAGTGGFKRYAP